MELLIRAAELVNNPILLVNSSISEQSALVRTRSEYIIAEEMNEFL